LLNSNKIIKELNLKSIILYENIYNIIYFGDFNILKKSLERSRLQININKDVCNIKII
jgi:hypothetical protein